jgi:hypothetical protein
MSDLASSWRTTFFQTVRRPEYAALLKAASLQGQLGQWTATLTEVAVSACQALGWHAAAKGHKLTLLPESRHEYLALDVMAFAPGEQRWPFPVAVMELENSQAEDRIAYSLWKVLCVRADLRLVFCYRRMAGTVPALIQFLQDEVIGAMGLSGRVALTGQTVLVVGSLYEVETFPNGFLNGGSWRPIRACLRRYINLSL